MAEPRYRCTACGRRGIYIFFPERDGRRTCCCGSTDVVLDGRDSVVESHNSVVPARRTISFDASPAATPTTQHRRRHDRRVVWTLVFLVSATAGAILTAAGNHVEDEHGGWLSGNPPGSGLVNAGAVFLLIATAIALVWLYRVVDRHIFTPVFQELQIALGPLPPVEALRHPDGTPLNAEEQAVARWQLAQRQAQARQQIALLGLVLWVGHHDHGGGGNHGS